MQAGGHLRTLYEQQHNAHYMYCMRKTIARFEGVNYRVSSVNLRRSSLSLRNLID